LSRAIQTSQATTAVERPLGRGIRIPAWAFIAAIVLFSVAALMVTITLRQQASALRQQRGATPAPTSVVIPDAPSTKADPAGG
jgi:hypothetical protein